MKKRPFLVGFLVASAAAAMFYVVIVGTFALLGKNGGFAQSVLKSEVDVGVVDVFDVIESSRKITEQIRDYVEDDSIRALLVRIDSPGGAVAPTQEIYDEVRRAIKAGKPVVATLGSTAASGAYYIAAGCSTIVANPGTLTGSIGVKMEFMDVEGAFDKLGLKSEVVKSGKYKDAGSPTRALTADERRMLQATIDDVHSQFVAAVAEGRNLPPEAVESIADGRIFSGQQALALGLVDQLGSFHDATDLLKEELGVKGKINLIFPKKRKPDFLDYFFDRMSDSLREGLRGLSARDDQRRLYFR